MRGSIAGLRLQAISDGKLGAGPVTLDLWADAETLRATKLQLVDTATDPVDPSTWTLTFSDYDQDVAIRAPIEC